MTQNTSQLDSTLDGPGIEPKAPRAKSRRFEISGATPAELISLFGSPVLFLLIFVVFAFWLGGSFYTPAPRMLELSQAIPATIVTLGVVLCLSSGEFDLSIAYNTSLAAYLVIGLNYRSGVPMWTSMLIVVAIAALIGLVNGFLITKLRINAFITTLGTGGVLLGVSQVYSGGGTGINPSPTDHPLPGWFSSNFGSFQNVAPAPVVVVLAVVLTLAVVHTVNSRVIPATVKKPVRAAILLGHAVVLLGLFFASGLISFVSVNVVIFLSLAAVLWLVMTYTTFGRNLYAVGSNPRAAEYAGINVAGHKMAAFALAGMLAGMAGVMLAASQGAAIQSSADGFLLPAYSAAFLSTVLISRGRFHIAGAVLGALVLVYVASGLTVGGVPYTWSDVFNGVVLIAAVALSSVVRKAGR